MSGKSSPGFNLVVIISLIFIFGQIAFGQDIIYVNSLAAPGGDGSGWAQAYKYLQDALADADTRPKTVEIWVAEGTYYPDEGEGMVPGDLDAFVANWNSQANKVWLNDGIGTFIDSGQSLGGSDSEEVALGDLDDDGDLDAFVANGWKANKIWLNDGMGTFIDSGQSLGSSYSYGVALGDLDRDDDLDAFVTNYDRQANKVWLNDGFGNFNDSGQGLGNSNSDDVALGDLDGDGDLDAFVANWSSQANKVWLNDSTGFFIDSGQSLGGSDSGEVALGDLDGDGDLDAFVANSGQANKVWLNDGSGTFSDSGQSLGSSESAGVALGDLDGDGDLDAFIANYLGQANKVWLNDGFGNFTNSGQSLGSSDSFGVALGDLDGDDDLDAFVANYAGQADKVWLNDGSGIFSDSGQSLGSSDSACVALGDLDGDSLDSTGDRSAAFQLINGVTIYGGFPSWGGFFEDRDPNIYITILKGDLLDNDPQYSDPCDMLTDANRSDNSFHVVTSSGTDSNAILDGFTITGGNTEFADSGGGLYNGLGRPTIIDCNFIANTATWGAAIYSFDGDPNIINCILTRNAASSSGGGLYNNKGEVNLFNCTISENQADAGGGIYVTFGFGGAVPKARLTNCRVIENSAINGAGGGMYLSDISEASISNCVFNGNTTQSTGGGVYADGKLNAINSVFSGNSAVSGGGIFLWGPEPNLTNCTFSQNSATEGGGFYSYNSDLDLTNCIFWDNTATDSNGPQIALEDCNATIAFSDVQGGQGDIYTKGSSNIYWDVSNIDQDPLFADADGPDDVAGTDDDNLRIASTSPCVDAGNNDINDANITTDLDGNPRFTDNPIVVDSGLGSPPIIDMGAYEVQNIYVDLYAFGDMNGSSWEDAFNFVQDGLYEARDGGASIFVAEGTYTPDANMMGSSYGDANATFQLINGVGLYGGFPTGGADWENRDPDNYITILSGDLWYDDMDVTDPNELLIQPSRVENSYHVVSANDVDSTAILDGFTIRGGNAVITGNDSGGGLYNYGGNPVIRDCNFTANTATYGGALWNYGNPKIINCIITKNAAENGGGGIYTTTGAPILTSCRIYDNFANSSGGGIYSYAPDLKMIDCDVIQNRVITGQGGGMYIKPLVIMHTKLFNCKFNGNVSEQSDAGGIYVWDLFYAYNCIFSGNMAQGNGGAIYSYLGDDPNFTNCTFSQNSATAGGGIYGHDTYDLYLDNCIFWDNTSFDSNGPQIALEDTDANIAYCDVQGGEFDITVLGTSVVYWDTNSNIDSDPLFIDPDGDDDIPGTDDDDVHLLIDSPCINAGDPNRDYSGQTDIDGQPRVIYGDVDMGADEHVIIADFDYSACVDFEDYADLVSAWLTGPTDELYNLIYDISEPPDGIIDYNDLVVFCDHWLEAWPPMY